MEMERFQKQMQFALEIDKAKQIFRQTYLAEGNRKENDAEHSWHIAIMAFLLEEHWDAPLDLAKVMKMLLLHDVVEIDAGDTYCYDEVGYQDKEERERACAKRIYGLLPEDQAAEYQALWEEFELGESSEAHFAVILDRLQPIMLNAAAGGKAWTEHGVTRSQVMRRHERTMDAPKEFSTYLFSILEDAVAAGYVKPI